MGRGPKAPAGPVSVSDLVDLPDGSLDMLLEPAAPQIRVSSSAPLIVLPEQETVPWQSDEPVLLPYGSVLRAGPLLVAPLSSEQAQAFEAGKLDLPIISDRAATPADEAFERDLSVVRSRTTRGRVFVGLLVTFFILAITVTLGQLLRATPPPTKVLVVLVGWSPSEIRELRDRTTRDLLAAGFVPIVSNLSSPFDRDGEIVDLASIARERGASHVLLLRIEPVNERPGLVEGHRFVVARTSGQVWSLADGAPGDEHSVDLAAEGPTLSAIRPVIGDSALQVLLPGLIADLAESETMTAYLEGLGTEDTAPGVDSLKTSRSGAKARQKEMGSFDQLTKYPRRQPGWGGAGIECLTRPGEVEYPVGIDPTGRIAVVQVSSSSVYFTTSVPSRIGVVPRPRRLDLVNLDDGSREVLVEAVNIHGLAEMSADGSSVAYIERSGDATALIHLNLASKARTVLELAIRPSSPERLFKHSGSAFATPRPSPDGLHVAYTRNLTSHSRWAIPSAGTTEILVREVSSKRVAEIDARDIGWNEEPEARPLSWVELTAGEASSRTTYLAIEIPWRRGSRRVVSDGPLREVRIPESVGGGTMKMRPHDEEEYVIPPQIALERPWSRDEPAQVTLGEEASLRVLSGRGNDLMFIADEDGRCRLARYHLATAEITTRDLEACPRGRVALAGGTIIGMLEAEGDGEATLVGLDAETGRVIPLPSKSAHENSVRGARDAPLVLFGRKARGVHPSLPCTAVCVMELGTPSSTN